jgi:DNA-binding beta-propeller fold protein YncE
MFMRMTGAFVGLLLVYCNITNLVADDAFQEFKIKRKEVFEFTKEPILKREDKDNTTITFSVKDFCDVTVAIETTDGRIIRHLASGVLGNKAPTPFKPNSLDQSVIWDHKDDSGKYFDDLSSIQVRVSLGLKAEYEKDLYYSPHKRISSTPAICAAPEGVYVFDSLGRDHVRLFDHDGKYIKTIYPFPASQLKNINGLKWQKMPDGRELPAKNSMYHQTLLSSGDNSSEWDKNTRNGLGATSIAVNGKRIALAFVNLNRLTSDGNTGGLPLKGGKTGIELPKQPSFPTDVGPSSMAFSPDGKTIYMTGYSWQSSHNGSGANSIMAVYQMNYEKNDDATIFVGEKTKSGNDDSHFAIATSVDTDKNGNVYVSDFGNDRIQIFDSSAKLLKTITVKKPTKVAVHQVTGEIYVFTWGMQGIPENIEKQIPYSQTKAPQKITIFSAYPETKQIKEDDFQLSPVNRLGTIIHIAFDSWAKNPTFWVSSRNSPLGTRCIQLKNTKWEESFKMNDLAQKDIIRVRPTSHNIQQLYFNPKNKKLYVGEPDSGPTGKAWEEMLEIDPLTNKVKLISLPINPQDIAFDLNGLIYLRTANVLARYDMNTWKEIPFDYGAERQKVGQDGGMGGVSAPVVSAIMLPARGTVCYHQGGLSINVNGDIAVACGNRQLGQASVGTPIDDTAKFLPMAFPGRVESPISLCVHIWDKFGKVIGEDVIKGAPQADGIAIDKENNIYMLATPARLIDGKPIDDEMSSTLIKFNKESKGRFLSTSGKIPLVLPEAMYPKRPKDLSHLWVENYEWMYGGCGFGGFNADKAGGGCACWFVRFKLDYFDRSFVPEPMQYGIAVLDSAGNLILKIGQYSNEDSKGKNSKEPLGGDEVGLFHPCFVAVDSDHRLFISDIGNEKIISVNLKYEINKILTFDKNTK